MRASKPHVPYLFHISGRDMEAGNRCAAMGFHIFHIFHIDFSCAHIGAHTRAPARVHVHTCTNHILDMEDMEDMEEGHRTSIFSFHISTTDMEDMEPAKESSWN